ALGKHGSAEGVALDDKMSSLSAELGIVPPFQPLQAFVVDTRKAEHVSEQCAIGIEMPRLRNQADSRQRQRPQALCFVRSQTSLKPNKVASVLELGFHLPRVDEKHPRQMGSGAPRPG